MQKFTWTPINNLCKQFKKQNISTIWKTLSSCFSVDSPPTPHLANKVP